MSYQDLARETARRYGIPEDLFLRQIKAESAWDPNALSSAGAIGLGQLMPGTAKELGVDPRDPAQNLDGAARYLRQQYDRFGDWSLALGAYNAGPGRITEYGGLPPFKETQNYVAKIMGGTGSGGGTTMSSRGGPSWGNGLSDFGPFNPYGGYGEDRGPRYSEAERNALAAAWEQGATDPQPELQAFQLTPFRTTRRFG